MFIDVSPMSQCNDDHEEDIVDDRVHDPVVPHPHSIARGPRNARADGVRHDPGRVSQPFK